ncbi:carbohydrate kinase [Clostridium folliculivorans]|uniref:Carbohydrate kinase n=2 Tax=Clostridium folliculivorans TaxID=2886038 RepID=A0A9W6DBI0_9CLOT|nr:carbohydrate kinase [Clostridium folliculivorans]GKU28082.1 carbohydrate kinase [Clostridium folliculivorans]
MISQKELANILGITRSSAAVHITNLIKKGSILGKGYVVKENQYATVVGGANIDIQGFPSSKLIYKDSNIGVVKHSLGGVGRNIAENMVRLGIHTKFISVVGEDVYGQKIIDEGRHIGMDVKEIMVAQGQSTSSYLSILDEYGDMAVAISHMDVIEKLDVNYLISKKHVLENSSITVIDTNLNEDVIKYIASNYKESKLFLDTVSTAKSMKVKDIIGVFHTIKPNKLEAEILSGIMIEDDTSLKRVGRYFIDAGVKNVFISLGSKGTYYTDGKQDGYIEGKAIKVVNATGAGDAFMAGLVYGELNDLSIKQKAIFGNAAAILALSHEDTINPNITVDNIYKLIEEEF